jgi:photosystem II stability/assembly factor-like uncharacterized protein
MSESRPSATVSPGLDPGRHGQIAPRAGPALLVGTRKGAWILRPDQTRRTWTTEGPLFLGNIVHHFVLDPRDRRTLLMATRAGHLGPTVFRSTDGGSSWQEATRPPAFATRTPGGRVRTVDQVFWLSPGHASEPGVWYAGTAPEGLFRSEDGGVSWESVSGWNDHARYELWSEDPDGETTPDGAPLHSVRIDPRDPAHIYLATSGGGVFESVDQGGDWRPLNGNVEANFLPDPEPPEFGQDTHHLALHPLRPDVLYQQNHCGIYRVERPSETWVRIGDAMPREVGDIGFPIGLHPRDPDTAWVFPMDGTDVWPRTSPDGRPAVYRTRDAGKSWQRQDAGLPSAPRTATSGPARTRGRPGSASRRTCPTCSPSRRPTSCREGEHPGAAAGLHAQPRGRGRR